MNEGRPSKLLHQQFPGLPRRALEFFSILNLKPDPFQKDVVHPRHVMEFRFELGQSKIDHNGTTQIPKLHAIMPLLSRLVAIGVLEVAAPSKTGNGDDTTFLCRMGPRNVEEIAGYLDFYVYGFPVIYDELRQSILPIVSTDPQGNEGIGTTLPIGENALITAAHCVTAARKIAIRGVKAHEFDSIKIVYPEDASVDLALLVFAKPILQGLRRVVFGEGEVLDEVIALGYPNIPTFPAILATERATISGRLTVTRGNITASARDIFSAAPQLLISARVRGGFSGGPIINDRGEVVGIVSRNVEAKTGDGADVYDAMGYGVAIPFQEVDKFLAMCASGSGISRLNAANITFTDFPD